MRPDPVSKAPGKPIIVIVPADSQETEYAGPFTAQERAIFAYSLGKGVPDYRGDPQAIETRFESRLASQNPEMIGKWLGASNRILSTRLLGFRRITQVIHHAFDLPEFSEACPSGLTVGDGMKLLDRFFAFLDRLRLKYRREAELVATYGSLPGRVHTYEREMGLWLNRERAQSFAGVAHWRGAIAASGVAQAHFALVDAMASSDEEAHELATTIEGDRLQAMAQVKGK